MEIRNLTTPRFTFQGVGDKNDTLGLLGGLNFDRLRGLGMGNLSKDLQDVEGSILKDFFGKGYDQPRETAIIAVFSVLILLGVLGNSLVCIIVLKRPKMRTPRNIFIINLAVCDLTFCLFTQPFNLVRMLHVSWNLGEVLCKLVPACSATNFYVSTISITAIALDRFQVIVFPTSDPMKTGKVVSLSLILIWVASICMALPIVFFYRLRPVVLWGMYIHDICAENADLSTESKVYSIVSMTLLYLAPILTVSVSHLLISRKLKNRMVNRARPDKRSREKSTKRGSKSVLWRPGHVQSSSYDLTASNMKEKPNHSNVLFVDESIMDGERNIKNENITTLLGAGGRHNDCLGGQGGRGMDEKAGGTAVDSAGNSPVMENIDVTDNEGGRVVFPGTSPACSGEGVSKPHATQPGTDPPCLPSTSYASIKRSIFHSSHEKSKHSNINLLVPVNQNERLLKKKSNLRREQRLQSHRQQLTQLESHLQQLNQQQMTRDDLVLSTKTPRVSETVASNQNPSLLTREGGNHVGKRGSADCQGKAKRRRRSDNVVGNRSMELPTSELAAVSKSKLRPHASFSVHSFRSKLRNSKKVSVLSFAGGPEKSRTERRSVDDGNALERQRKCREDARKRKRKTNRLLLTIAIVFAISWLPMNLFNLLSDFHPVFVHSLNKRSNHLLAPACLLMVLVSACVNPLLYGWLNENFRQEFQQIFCCCSQAVERWQTKGSVNTRGRLGSSRFKS